MIAGQAPNLLRPVFCLLALASAFKISFSAEDDLIQNDITNVNSEDKSGLRAPNVIDVTAFSKWAYGSAKTPKEARTRLQKLLPSKMTAINYFCNLSDAEKQKLEQAWESDVERLFLEADKLDVLFRSVLPDKAKARDIFDGNKSIRRQIQLGPYGNGSRFHSCLDELLTRDLPKQGEILRDILGVGGQIAILGPNARSAEYTSTVNLYGSWFESAFGDEGMLRLKQLPNLQTLRLDNTQVTDVGIAQLEEITCIQWLNLSHSKISDRGLTFVSGLINLKELKLAGTQVSDIGVSEISRFKQLENLDLAKTRVTDAGIAHLSELSNLHHLSLSNTGVTSNVLPTLGMLQSLSDLDLSNTQLTDEGLEKLASCIELKRLNLSNTQVSNLGLQRLKNIRRLNYIELHATNATLVGVNELKQHFPRAQINFPR